MLAMSPASGILIAAIFTAIVGGPFMWFLQRFDKRNSAEHAANGEILKDIRSGVEHISVRLDDHLEWHAETPARLQPHRKREAS